jgi:hypothetical protein
LVFFGLETIRLATLVDFWNEFWRPSRFCSESPSCSAEMGGCRKEKLSAELSNFFFGSEKKIETENGTFFHIH